MQVLDTHSGKEGMSTPTYGTKYVHWECTLCGSSVGKYVCMEENTCAGERVTMWEEVHVRLRGSIWSNDHKTCPRTEPGDLGTANQKDTTSGGLSTYCRRHSGHWRSTFRGRGSPRTCSWNDWGFVFCLETKRNWSSNCYFHPRGPRWGWGKIKSETQGFSSRPSR